MCGQIDVQNSLVIFDEAHNMEDVCRDSLSLNSRRSDIDGVEYIITTY